MATAAANSYAKPLDNVIELLSQTTVVRTWNGTASAAAARAKMYFEHLPYPGSDADEYTAAELAAIFPAVIVGYAEPDNPVRLAKVSFDTYQYEGILLARFISVVGSGDATDQHEAWVKFANHVGAILEGVTAASLAGAGLVETNEWGVAEKPMRSDLNGKGDARGDYQTFALSWTMESVMP